MKNWGVVLRIGNIGLFLAGCPVGIGFQLLIVAVWLALLLVVIDTHITAREGRPPTSAFWIRTLFFGDLGMPNKPAKSGHAAASGDDTSSDTTLELWKSTVSEWSKEADRYWKRNTLFLAVNGAALFMYREGHDAVRTLVPWLAIVLSLLWLAVNARGNAYQSAWMQMIQSIEEDTDWSIKPISQLLESDRARMPHAPSLMNLVVWSIVGSWLYLLLFG